MDSGQSRGESGSQAVAVRGMVNLEAVVMDRLNAAVVVTDLEGRLLYANPYAERAFGWVAESMVGSMTGELGKVEVPPEMAAEIGACLHEGRTWEGDFEVTRADGSLLTVHASDAGLHDETGELVGVVSIVTDITDQRESVSRLSRETEALRFLLDATTVLSTSLDFEVCLRRLADLTVPLLGDLCLIDVVVDRSIVRMAASHADARYQPLVDELAKYPPDPDGDHPAVRAIRTGRSEISPEMSDEFLDATTRGSRHLEIIEQLGFTSYMSAPLLARGRTLGALTLVSAGSGRRFDSEDVALAEELAHRAALVIDNARLFSERARVARSLQSALLPPTLPEIPGLQLAARYLAAGEGNDVGGDFYDVFSIGRGAWAAAVGDVCGTGPDAAAMTGLVRHSLQASAQQSRDPAAMLRTANAVLCDQPTGDGERFCSVCCAIVRPGRFVRVTLACGGHPPPLVVRAAGTVEEVQCRGLLLGIRPELPLHSRRCVLSEGDVLVMYTDGLTEARNAEGVLFGEGPVQQVLAGCAGRDAEDVARMVLDAVTRFTEVGLTDDLALLVIAAGEHGQVQQATREGGGSRRTSV